MRCKKKEKQGQVGVNVSPGGGDTFNYGGKKLRPDEIHLFPCTFPSFSCL